MNIKMEDIPESLHQMVEIVGIEKFVMICKMYGGATIYIPVYNKVVMGDRNRKIVRDYNGKNLDKLRVRYNISKEQLKFILKKEGGVVGGEVIIANFNANF